MPAMDDTAPGVQCTYFDCCRRFASHDDMILHKTKEPEHNYCEKCNVDCASFEGLISHKVEAMRPHIGNAESEPVHIVCEFCGMDFGSWGGRDIHRRSAHQEKQTITCDHCPTRIFGQASDFIKHIEHGRCDGISSVQLYAAVKHKVITKEVMKDTDSFTAAIQKNLEKNTFMGPDMLEMERDEDDAASTPGSTLTSTSSSGGVSLPRSTTIAETTDNTSLSQRNLNAQWPDLGSLSIRSKQQNPGSRSTIIAPHLKAKAAATRGSAPSVSNVQTSPRYGTSSKSTLPGGSKPPPSAWSSGKPSSALFAPTKATARMATDDEILPPRQYKNTLTIQWWNANSPDYRADAFFNPDSQAYECPLTKCRGVWKDPHHFAHHLQDHGTDGHASDIAGHPRFRCRWCAKLFDAIFKLVAHMESPGVKCRAHKSLDFPRFIDEVTGGLLRAEAVVQPSVLRGYTDSDLVLFELAGGVMETKYTSTQEDVQW